MRARDVRIGKALHAVRDGREANAYQEAYRRWPSTQSKVGDKGIERKLRY